MKTAHSEKGSSVVPIIIGVVVVLFIGFYIGIQPGGFLSKKIMQSVPSQDSSIPTNQWLTYTSTDPQFSVKYPSDWGYQVRAGGESVNLLAVQFLPKGGDAEDKLNNVTVRVLSRDNAPSLQDWINAHTTNLKIDDPQVKNKKYALFSVSDMNAIRAGNKDAINFTTDISSIGTKADGTIFASEKYIFVVLGMRGKAVDTRNKITESLSF